MTSTGAGAEADSTVRAQQTAWKRGLAVSDELRKAARAVRQTTTSKPVSAWTRLSDRALGYRRFSTAGGRWPRFAPLVFGLLIPAILVAGYIGFGMSSQYTSEARLAVRGGEQVSADPISAFTGLSSFTQAQDSLIVVSYVKSRAIVEELERTIGLRQMFSRSDIDWPARFTADAPIEDLVKYWRWKIKTNVESPSGIITIQVSAFAPEDALKIADAVVSASERLVNSMSTRASRDAMEKAQTELARSERRLGDVRMALQDLRNAQSTLNPRRTAEGINKLIGELRLERARLEDDANAAKRSQVNEGAPQMQLLRIRIAVIGDQMADLERQLTSTTDTAATATVSGKITRFDELELERQIAEKQYTLATESFERARINAERQKVYLTTFVTPLLPHDVAWPKSRFWFALAGLLVVAVLYWIGTLVATSLFGRRTP
jgi:capsular polysaccharide transport system permease protein